MSARRAVRAGSLGHLPEDRLVRPPLDVLVGEGRLALRPGLDALDEGSGFVVARLADGQDRVEVDVRVDEGRGDEPARGVELPAAVGGEPTRRSDRSDAIALDREVDGVDRSAERGMDARIADDESGRRHRHLWAGAGTPAQCAAAVVAESRNPGRRRVPVVRPALSRPA
jgi:hypothetical protein